MDLHARLRLANQRENAGIRDDNRIRAKGSKKQDIFFHSRKIFWMGHDIHRDIGFDSMLMGVFNAGLHFVAIEIR